MLKKRTVYSPTWMTNTKWFSKCKFKHKFTDLWANPSIPNKKDLVAQSIAISLSMIQHDFWQQWEASSSHPTAAHLKFKHMFYEEKMVTKLRATVSNCCD